MVKKHTHAYYQRVTTYMTYSHIIQSLKLCLVVTLDNDLTRYLARVTRNHWQVFRAQAAL